MTIGSTIRQLRQEQDITQEQLAEALGLTSRAVSQWETDRTSPDISQLPALANFFDVTTDHLLGLDIKRKEEELDKIYVQINRYNEIGDQKGLEEYIREQLKTYPNDPNLLTHLAFALQNYYFGQGKADTEELKKEKSNEIITLCERALKYYKPTENNSFPKQQLIIHYIYYLHDKEKAKEIVMSLPNVGCTREMFLGDLYEGKEALERRQAALLWSFTQMMHNLFWNISCDDSYTFEQKIEILKADDAMIELITGGKPNFFHCKLSVNAATQAVYYLKLGDEENALDMLEAAYDHADSYETRPDGEKYAPCWLSELDDKLEYVGKPDPDTDYDRLYNIIIKPENKFCEVFDGNERFGRLMDKLKEKIGE
ncbi:MAG: helix-turn-helix domain-containing protein [Oscillospiraceae bacterium]|nr:helix-turn-helix domain-containing protein [Oscillospiraceae bacterium]